MYRKRSGHDDTLPSTRLALDESHVDRNDSRLDSPFGDDDVFSPRAPIPLSVRQDTRRLMAIRARQRARPDELGSMSEVESVVDIGLQGVSDELGRHTATTAAAEDVNLASKTPNHPTPGLLRALHPSGNIPSSGHFETRTAPSALDLDPDLDLDFDLDLDLDLGRDPSFLDGGDPGKSYSPKYASAHTPVFNPVPVPHSVPRRTAPVLSTQSRTPQVNGSVASRTPASHTAEIGPAASAKRAVKQHALCSAFNQKVETHLKAVAAAAAEAGAAGEARETDGIDGDDDDHDQALGVRGTHNERLQRRWEDLEAEAWTTVEQLRPLRPTNQGWHHNTAGKGRSAGWYFDLPLIYLFDNLSALHDVHAHCRWTADHLAVWQRLIEASTAHGVQRQPDMVKFLDVFLAGVGQPEDRWEFVRRKHGSVSAADEAKASKVVR